MTEKWEHGNGGAAEQGQQVAKTDSVSSGAQSTGHRAALHSSFSTFAFCAGPLLLSCIVALVPPCINVLRITPLQLVNKVPPCIVALSCELRDEHERNACIMHALKLKNEKATKLLFFALPLPRVEGST